jgi:predicted metal-dependent hydrolase
VTDVQLVRHPRARRYIIRVRPDGSVRVSIPRWGSRRQALAFVEREQAWIDKERGRVAAEQALVRQLAPPPHVERALRKRARVELPARLVELAAALGVSASRVSVRNQRWRWGSCSRRGHICLNWRLVAMPSWVRDYVIVHELMHLKRLDHSPRFWKLVAAACPEHEQARAWLREHASRPECLHYN